MGAVGGPNAPVAGLKRWPENGQIVALFRAGKCLITAVFGSQIWRIFGPGSKGVKGPRHSTAEHGIARHTTAYHSGPTGFPPLKLPLIKDSLKPIET